MLNNRQNLTNQQLALLTRVKNAINHLIRFPVNLSNNQHQNSLNASHDKQNPNSPYNLAIDELVLFFKILEKPSYNHLLSKIDYFSLPKNNQVIIAAFNALSNNTNISLFNFNWISQPKGELSNQAIDSIVNFFIKNKNITKLTLQSSMTSITELNEQPDNNYISAQVLLKILAEIKNNKLLESLEISLCDYTNLEDDQYTEKLAAVLDKLIVTLNSNKTITDLYIGLELQNSTNISLLSEYLSQYHYLNKLELTFFDRYDFIPFGPEDGYDFGPLLPVLKIIEANNLTKFSLHISAILIDDNINEINKYSKSIEQIIKNKPNLINFSWTTPKSESDEDLIDANNEIKNIINANIKQAGKLLLKAIKLIDKIDDQQTYCVYYNKQNYNYRADELCINNQAKQLALAKEILNTKPAIFEILSSRKSLFINSTDSFESLKARYTEEELFILYYNTTVNNPDQKQIDSNYQTNLKLITKLYPTISNDQLSQHFFKQLDQRLNQIIIDPFQPNTDFTNNLDKVSTRYQQLQDKLAKLSKLNLTDTTEFSQLSKEHSDLVPIVKKINELIISDKLPDDCLRLILEFADDQSKIELIDKINQIKAASDKQVNRQPAEPAAESHANRHLKRSASFTQNLTEQPDNKRANQR